MWSRHEYPKHEVFTLNLKEDCERELRVWMCVCLACVRFETQHHKEVREWKKRSMGTSMWWSSPPAPCWLWDHCRPSYGWLDSFLMLPRGAPLSLVARRSLFTNQSPCRVRGQRPFLFEAGP